MGKVVQAKWTDSKHYPGTERNYWVYIPAQHDGKRPANLMVFQDGGGFVRENGHTRVPIVFDNLIHRGELPVTVGLFVNPGVVPPAELGNQPRLNRAFEYDTVDSQYASFLIDELLPHVVKKHDFHNCLRGLGTLTNMNPKTTCLERTRKVESGKQSVSYTHLTLPTKRIV